MSAHLLSAGCPRHHELLRLRVAGPAPGPRQKAEVVSFTCPRCGEEHSALDLYGRPDDGRPVDLDLAPPASAEEPLPDVDRAPEPPPRRPRLPAPSDATIRAALPAEGASVAADDLARELGYSGKRCGANLVTRLRRHPGNWPDLEILPGRRGHREDKTLLRRVG